MNMNTNELAIYNAEFFKNNKDKIIEALEKDDMSIIRDEAYEYIENCD